MQEIRLKLPKTPARSSEIMYRKVKAVSNSAEEFELPFAGQLAEENRWVIMAQLIPWSEYEEEYAANFAAEMGAPAKPFRTALGALIIKEKLGISDRETVEQIRENPYLQYFIGQSSYSNEMPFDPSLMVYFRERISAELITSVNRAMVKRMLEIENEELKKKREKKKVKKLKIEEN